MDLMGAGTIWRDEAGDLPVLLRDASGDPETGVAYTGVTVKYAREADSSLVTLTLAADTWKEKGRGLYAFTLPAATLNAEGLLEYCAYTPTGEEFFGTARVQARRYEVLASVGYDETDQELSFVVALLKDGQLVTSPTSCQVTLKKEGAGSALADSTSVSPNADGVFNISVTGVDPSTLEGDRPYTLKARVTYAGIAYYSMELPVLLD